MLFQLLTDLFTDYTLRTVALGAAILGLVSGSLGSFASTFTLKDKLTNPALCLPREAPPPPTGRSRHHGDHLAGGYFLATAGRRGARPYPG